MDHNHVEASVVAVWEHYYAIKLFHEVTDLERARLKLNMNFFVD
jgi:hypothetical protein